MSLLKLGYKRLWLLPQCALWYPPWITSLEEAGCHVVSSLMERHRWQESGFHKELRPAKNHVSELGSGSSSPGQVLG